VRISPWPDPVLDTLGHDPRSRYVELFWLPTLGPTSVLLLRHLADRFERDPDGFDLDPATTSGMLGLGARDSSGAPLRRSLQRLTTFDLAHATGDDGFVVRRHVPPVQRHHVRRLPAPLRDLHLEWVETASEEAPAESLLRRARASAFVLFEQGTDSDVVERWLARTGFSPRVAHEATAWACERHRHAQRASNSMTSAS
jgi:hypothetical protein